MVSPSSPFLSAMVARFLPPLTQVVQDNHHQDPEEFYVKQDRIGALILHCLAFLSLKLLEQYSGKGSFGEVYKGYALININQTHHQPHLSPSFSPLPFTATTSAPRKRWQ